MTEKEKTSFFSVRGTVFFLSGIRMEHRSDGKYRCNFSRISYKLYEAADNPQDPEMQYFQQKMSCILQIFWYNPVSAHPCVASIATPYVREEVKEMSRYELIYIIDTAVEDSARKELIERVNNLIAANGGEVEKVDETWGKRRLAYAINYKTEGWYVLVTFKANGELPRELERNLRNYDAVIRYMTVKIEEKRSSVKPRPVRPVAVAEETEKVAEKVEEVSEVADNTDAE